MNLLGRVLKFGDHINTDVIIPARYLYADDSEHLAKYCFQDLDLTISPGTILLAGKNFGCGSSREHAPISLKAAGVSCIIACSYGRIFYRNAINIGLPILTSQEVVDRSNEGDELQVFTHKGKVINLSTGQSYGINPLPPFIHEIIEAGGLMEYNKRRYNHAKTGSNPR